MKRCPAFRSFSNGRLHHPRRGAALVITLVLLSLMAIIAVALAIAMRTDRTSARFFLDRTKAGMFEEQGVNHALALLRTISGNTNYGWAVGPGQGYVSASASNKSLTISIPLHSGLGTLTDQPNLNMASFAAPGNYAINPANVPMRVQWLYVRQNGQIDSAVSPALSNSNPVVGRYGFWVDTESSRVNWNTAYKRDTSKIYTLSPDNIDLTALPLVSATPAIADQVHQFVRTTRFFNSPEDVRSVNTSNDPAISSAINTNRFTTTYFSHDPELTYWGAPRIVLTTRRKLAGNQPFIDILNNPDTDDPGLLDNINLYTKLPQVVNQIADYLNRSDWPVGPAGASFGSKFFDITAYPNQAEARRYFAIQLALHIVDYVRAKESSQEIVQRLTGTMMGNNFMRTWNDASIDFSSHSRQVHITEMGVYIEPTPLVLTPPDPFQYGGKFIFEVHLPRNYGLASYDLNNLAAQIIWNISWYGGAYTLPSPVTLDSSNVKVNNSAGTILPAGGYAVVTIPFTYNPPRYPWSTPARPTSLFLKVYLFPKNKLDPSYNVEAAPIITAYYNGLTGIVPYNLDPPGVTQDQIRSLETDDPRINGDLRDWTPRVSNNTFGAVNSCSTLGGAPSSSAYSQAPQDADSSNRITDANLYMPAPAGSASNPDGIVHSVAELGCVLTGSQGEYGSAPQPRSVPWRTLRFQPTKQQNTLPDWAILDLFSVPMNTSTLNTAIAFTSTNSNSISGRINLNGTIAPFEPSVPLDRLAPLTALLKGVTFSGGASYSDVANNIYRRTLVDNPLKYGGNTNLYSLRGEIAEVSGVADNGESSESALQNIADLVTTQANVFRVYSVGQAIQQTKDNRYLSTGESRGCTFVERLMDSTGKVTFHVIYHRDINF